MTFESSREREIGSEAGSMLARLEKRVNVKLFQADIVEAMADAKNLLNIHINNATSDQIADFTSARKAWKKDGVFRSKPETLAKLQKLERGPLAHYARQLWRTEMVSYVLKKLNDPSCTRTDKPDVVNNILFAEPVDSKRKPAISLSEGVNVDEALKKPVAVESIAKKMEKGKSGKVEDFEKLFPEYSIVDLKIVVGGALVSFPLDLSSRLEFKNMAMEDGRVYAQMKNGCEGNLVIFEIQKGTPPEHKKAKKRLNYGQVFTSPPGAPLPKWWEHPLSPLMGEGEEEEAEAPLAGEGARERITTPPLMGEHETRRAPVEPPARPAPAPAPAPARPAPALPTVGGGEETYSPEIQVLYRKLKNSGIRNEIHQEDGTYYYYFGYEKYKIIPGSVEQNLYIVIRNPMPGKSMETRLIPLNMRYPEALDVRLVNNRIREILCEFGQK